VRRIDGGSPTQGFLGNAATGPFQDFYHNIAGTAWADWLFMIGLAGIGIALLLGIGVRIAAVAGGILYVMMWTVVLPPENNPFMDEHLIFAAVLAGLALVGAGKTLGLGNYWANSPSSSARPGCANTHRTNAQNGAPPLWWRPVLCVIMAAAARRI
jgi:thiosulfate dehydrogenase [quinone] large subunit